MKGFIKTAFLVIIVVLLTSTFLSEGKAKLSSSLENDIIIVDKGEALDSSDNITYIEPSDNIFAKIGSALSNLLSSLANMISKLIGGFFVYRITLLVFF